MPLLRVISSSRGDPSLRFQQHQPERAYVSSTRILLSGFIPILLLILGTSLLPYVSATELATSVVGRDDTAPPAPLGEIGKRGAQYCQREDPAFCVSVASKHNRTTGHQDLYVSLLAQPSSKGGWTGVGIGKNMGEALMFIMYSEQSRVRLTTSVRSAPGHVMPAPISHNATEVATLRADVNKVGAEYLAAWVCYSCDAWLPASRPAPLRSSISSALSLALSSGERQDRRDSSDPMDDSTFQPFIYAANSQQIFYSADEDSTLMIHDSFGLLAVDLATASIADNEPIPSIITDGDEVTLPMSSSFGARLVQTSAQIRANRSSSTSFPSAVQLHGILMTLSFLGIFTSGTILLRLPLLSRASSSTASKIIKIIPIPLPGNRTFKLRLKYNFSPVRLHWTFQLLGTLITLSSGIYMLTRTLSRRPIRMDFHKLLGILILFAIVTQFLLGWRNHVSFLRTRRPARTLNAVHRWLGRSVLCLGVFNVGVGMWYRGFGVLGLGVWLAVVGVEVVGYSFVVVYFNKNSKAREGFSADTTAEVEYSDGLVLDEEEEE
jgi:cytochrome b561